MSFDISNRYTRMPRVLCYHSDSATTIKEACEDANLKNANLYGADLYGANLKDANLGGANLYRADLCGANLYRADLGGANLKDADLYGADLCGANLKDANLYCADLGGADLCGADLCGANLYRADLGGANLKNAILEHDTRCNGKFLKLTNVCEWRATLLAFVTTEGQLRIHIGCRKMGYNEITSHWVDRNDRKMSRVALQMIEVWFDAVKEVK
jgi:hypothetical protein